MKNVTLTTLTLVGLMFVSGSAHANYECKSGDYASTLTVNEHHITHYGNASVVLTSGSEQTHYFGTIHSEGGFLMGKKVTELFYPQGTLTIVSKPQSCGRGGCDINADPIITANLQIGETSTYFYCNETNP